MIKHDFHLQRRRPYYLRHSFNPQETLLMLYCNTNNAACVELLLTVYPQCVHEVDADGNTALHYLCKKDRREIRGQQEDLEVASSCVSSLDETILIASLLFHAGINPHHLNNHWQRAVDSFATFIMDYHENDEHGELKTLIEEEMKSSKWICHRLTNLFLLTLKAMQPCFRNCIGALTFIVCCPVLCPSFLGCMAWYFRGVPFFTPRDGD